MQSTWPLKICCWNAKRVRSGIPVPFLLGLPQPFRGHRLLIFVFFNGNWLLWGEGVLPLGC